MAYAATWRHPVARTLVLATGTAHLGEWLGLAGLSVLAYTRAGTAMGPASTIAAQGIAALLASLALGSRLDRVERRRGVVCTYALGAAALLIPLLWTSALAVPVTAAVLGALKPVITSLRQAVIGNEMAHDLIGPTVALNQVVSGITLALGLTIGGSVVVLLGPEVAIAADLLALVVAAVLCRDLPRGRGVDRRGDPFHGFRIITGDRAVLRTTLVLLAVSAVASVPEVMATVAASESPWLPAVIGGQAIGTALGGWLLGHRRSFERPVVLSGMLGVTAVALLAGSALSGSLPLLALANLAVGLGMTVMTLSQTAFVKLAPAGSLGAATSAAFALMLVVEGVGSLAAGGIATRGGVGAAYVASAAFLAVASLLTTALTRRHAATDVGVGTSA